MNLDLPLLKIVKLSCLCLHEGVDPNRTKKLLERIRIDKVLFNPPLVTKIKRKSKFVVLDGANRVTVLKESGIQDIVVQLADYADNKIKLKTWNYVVCGLQAKEFLKKLESYSASQW